MLLEGFVDYCQQKGIRLPFLLVILLIALSFMWGMIDPSEVTRKNLKSPPLSSEPEIRHDPKPNPLNHQTEDLKWQAPIQVDSHHTQDRPQDEHQRTSVSHFKDHLTESLKVEGLDEDTSNRIFRHIRSQLETDPNVPYQISDSVQAVVPDASLEEVEYLSNEISRIAQEAFEQGQRQ